MNTSMNNSIQSTSVSMLNETLHNIAKEENEPIMKNNKRPKKPKTKIICQKDNHEYKINSSEFESHIQNCDECVKRKLEIDILRGKQTESINQRETFVNNEKENPLDQTVDTLHRPKSKKNNKNLDFSMCQGVNFKPQKVNINRNKKLRKNDYQKQDSSDDNEDSLEINKKNKKKKPEPKKRIIEEESSGNESNSDEEDDLNMYFANVKPKQKKNKKEINNNTDEEEDEEKEEDEEEEEEEEEDDCLNQFTI